MEANVTVMQCGVAAGLAGPAQLLAGSHVLVDTSVASRLHQLHGLVEAQLLPERHPGAIAKHRDLQNAGFERTMADRGPWSRDRPISTHTISRAPTLSPVRPKDRNCILSADMFV